jgi:hypothetical protein
MAYKLNKTDGTLLTELVDGQIDNTSCDLTLIGRNYVGFGEALNENLIKLLENFAATSAPGTPIVGQLWYDTSEGRLKVYNGTGFKSNGPIVQNTRPQMVSGDIWIDNANNQMYFFDGSDLVLVGPVYKTAQGLSGWQVDTVRDRSSVDHTVVKMYVGGVLTAIVSNDEFLPTVTEQTRLNITTSIFKGINVIDQDNFRFYGVADSSNSLITDAIDPATGLRIRKTAAQFLPSDSNGETIGALSIRNQTGLTIGRSGESRYFISGDYTNFQNTIVDKGIRFRMLNNADNEYDGLLLTANNRRMGVNLEPGDLPRASFDVNGDAIIRGDLTVEGSNTVLETTTLSVDDINIELGHADTIITLSAALSATLAGQLIEGELITQSSSNATGLFKSLSTDRTTLVLEPRDGNFTSGGDTLTAATTGVLYEADLATTVTVNSVSQRRDFSANGSGIIIKGAPSLSNANDKHIKWFDGTTEGQATDYFESSDHFSLASGKTYMIDNTEVMTETALGIAVEDAPGIHDVGVMDRLRVGDYSPGAGTTRILLDQLNLYGNDLPTLQTPLAGLRIDSNGVIEVTNQGNDVRITGLAYPSSDPSDATNKEYVDHEIDIEPVTLALDISGMPGPGFASVDDQILDTLEFLFPAQFKEVGAQARVLTSSSVGVVSNIDVESAFDFTGITVDFSDIGGTDGGDPGQELIQDVGFTGNATGVVTLSVTRVKRYFHVIDNGGTNIWATDATPDNTRP